MATTTLDFLIPSLRLTIGDIDSSSYRYTDAWLLIALQESVKALANWWHDRYLINTANAIYRNETSATPYVFDYNEPPVVQIGDERPIIVYASLITLEGSLENSSWDIGSWRDAEIAYSNIASGNLRGDRIKRLWLEMEGILTPPTKKLARPTKGDLPGYKNNRWERNTKY